ncbi:2-succinyl-5-enolpyruvyl-6-hydroxy-3-cyclohexene-1-carboxylic-acid synthase [Roseivirga sp. BDSF3-8]|uniref:2-succinyl-5-enolpyruvyl-6-hydroxy-3- cyclohexene-1-carboxylic-acid synthase n=1 Tax=Roseivirga sp. BDSF3-8 TaxID=3241598 RepID=UPI0035325788
MIIQSINDIAEICTRLGVKEAVLSPGSRSAPLTLAFARHPGISCRVIGDERSAAFVALGMAQTSNRPVAIVCTSGSAAYNYAPAIAEAFFNQVPLLVFTADRPPEWIDQLDGQTIRQNNIYGQHIKASFTFPVDTSHADATWHAHRQISEAVGQANAYPAGPVHVNVPVREPFYPGEGEHYGYAESLRVTESLTGTPILNESQKEKLAEEWAGYSRILVIAGQQTKEPALAATLREMADKTGATVMGDILSNIHGLPQAIRRQDTFLSALSEEELERLRPDLLITVGRSVIAKNLKLFLRKYRPDAHWHIQPSGVVADTYQSLTKVIHSGEATTLEWLATLGADNEFTERKRANYSLLWTSLEKAAERGLQKWAKEDRALGEFEAVYEIIKTLPQNTHLHLANSMPVRYANICGLAAERHDISVYANRGTSGIDGCTGTAVGCALETEDPVVLLTGDMAFFYDRNSLWHGHLPKNLRIVILNNHGGGIFRLINGPSSQPELETYFETEQPLKAENTARELGLDYYFCREKSRLFTALTLFMEPSDKPALLEVETESVYNAEVFKVYKAFMKKHLNESDKPSSPTA